MDVHTHATVACVDAACDAAIICLNMHRRWKRSSVAVSCFCVLLALAVPVTGAAAGVHEGVMTAISVVTAIALCTTLYFDPAGIAQVHLLRWEVLSAVSRTFRLAMCFEAEHVPSDAAVTAGIAFDRRVVRDTLSRDPRSGGFRRTARCGHEECVAKTYMCPRHTVHGPRRRRGGPLEVFVDAAQHGLRLRADMWSAEAEALYAKQVDRRAMLAFCFCVCVGTRVAKYFYLKSNTGDLWGWNVLCAGWEVLTAIGVALLLWMPNEYLRFIDATERALSTYDAVFQYANATEHDMAGAMAITHRVAAVMEDIEARLPPISTPSVLATSRRAMCAMQIEERQPHAVVAPRSISFSLQMNSCGCAQMFKDAIDNADPPITPLPLPQTVVAMPMQRTPPPTGLYRPTSDVDPRLSDETIDGAGSPDISVSTVFQYT